MSFVRYKLKNTLDYDSVYFDGMHISVSDLKKAIMQQKQMQGFDYNLQITNAETNEVYNNDESLLVKNDAVIVARVPKVPTGKRPRPQFQVDDKGHIHFDELANKNATEDDKIQVMIAESTSRYNPSNYVKNARMTGPVPHAYICHGCGKQGHWVKNCPESYADIKRSTGIPRSHLVPVAPEHKGALITNSGECVLPITDSLAHKEVKTKKPFIFKPKIPEELFCMFCNNLLQEAVLLPCCGNSLCDACARQSLLDSDDYECPVCNKANVFFDTAIPNCPLRLAVLNFENKTGYAHVKKHQLLAATATHMESLQSLPNSTIKNQPNPGDQNSSHIKVKCEPKEEGPVLISTTKKKEGKLEEGKLLGEPMKKPPSPSRPSDEPVDDSTEILHIQQVGPAHYNDSHYKDSKLSEISTIETIISRRTDKRQPNMYHHGQQHYSAGIQQWHRGIHGKYDSRNHYGGPPPQGQLNQYDMFQNNRYRYQGNQRDYVRYTNERQHVQESPYDTHLQSIESRRPDFYALYLHSSVIPAAVVPEALSSQMDITSQHRVQPTAFYANQHIPAFLPPAQAQFFSSLPSDTGPLLSNSVLSEMPSFHALPSELEEMKLNQEERSMYDGMEAFESELNKQTYESIFERASRSSSMSSLNSSPRSHSKLYSSLKIRPRTSSRSLAQSPQSRLMAFCSNESRYQSARNRQRSREREERYGNSRDRQYASYSKDNSSRLGDYHPQTQYPPSVRQQFNPPVQYGRGPYNPIALSDLMIKTESDTHVPSDDVHQHAPEMYDHERHEQESGTHHYRNFKYQKKYPRCEIQQRISGRVGDRDRNYGRRFGQVRDQQRNKISEMPKHFKPVLKSKTRIRACEEKQYVSRWRTDAASRREVSRKVKEETIDKTRKEKRSFLPSMKSSISKEKFSGTEV